MINQNFINEFAGIIEVEPNIIGDNFDIKNQSAWDSLAFICTIALVDKHFGIVLDGDALANTESFGQLCNLIQKRAA